LREVQAQAELLGLFQMTSRRPIKVGWARPSSTTVWTARSNPVFLAFGIDHAAGRLAGDVEHRAHQLAGAIDDFSNSFA